MFKLERNIGLRSSTMGLLPQTWLEIINPPGSRRLGYRMNERLAAHHPLTTKRSKLYHLLAVVSHTSSHLILPTFPTLIVHYLPIPYSIPPSLYYLYNIFIPAWPPKMTLEWNPSGTRFTRYSSITSRPSRRSCAAKHSPAAPFKVSSPAPRTLLDRRWIVQGKTEPGGHHGQACL